MQETKQDYAKKSFDEIAYKYDEIPFFKISARYVVDIIKKYKNETALEVLDVACGTGNVVLECATCMAEVNFDAVDIAEGLENIDFHLQDMIQLTLGKKYDVITCAYALFFLPEAHNVLNTLVSLLKEDGIVIFTSFTQKAFKVSNEILLPLLVKYGSSSAKEYDMHKWENLKHKKDIEKLCDLAEVSLVALQSKEIRYGMSVDAWWELMNNTGYKGMLMELSSENYEALKQEYFMAMFSHADMDGEVELVADSWYAVVK